MGFGKLPGNWLRFSKNEIFGGILTSIFVIISKEFRSCAWMNEIAWIFRQKILLEAFRFIHKCWLECLWGLFEGFGISFRIRRVSMIFTTRFWKKLEIHNIENAPQISIYPPQTLKRPKSKTTRKSSVTIKFPSSPNHRLIHDESNYFSQSRPFPTNFLSNFPIRFPFFFLSSTSRN